VVLKYLVLLLLMSVIISVVIDSAIDPAVRCKRSAALLIDLADWPGPEGRKGQLVISINRIDPAD
jgi:hypothetical protein